MTGIMEHPNTNTTNINNTTKKKSYRTAPYPNTILDRNALIIALQDAGLYYDVDVSNNHNNDNVSSGGIIKPIHIDTFYQALHRQHYPSLKEFVLNYYHYETIAIDSNTLSRSKSMNVNHNNNNNPVTNDNDENNNTNNVTTNEIIKRRPLKNKISINKNMNKKQIPKIFLLFLQNTKDFITITSTISQIKQSLDKSTTKLIIQLHDDQYIESVIMRYNTYNKTTNNKQQKDDEDKEEEKEEKEEKHTTTSSTNSSRGNGRASLCVSSQCGCAMGCTFCATGTMGLSGNLTTGEILEQIVHADRILAKEWEELYTNNNEENNEKANENQISPPQIDLIRNVVFMGMGEPLDNYNNVVNACRALIDKKRWNLACGRVTVSTVGIINKIKKLTIELPDISLALSLHAPNQELRTSIVPAAKRYPINELINALDGHMMSYLKKRKQRQLQRQNNDHNDNTTSTTTFTQEERIKESSRRRAMIEYVMLDGPTSTFDAAHQLGKLCEGKQLIVNLIPYNQTDVKDLLKCPTYNHMEQFKNIVSSYGTFCTIRKTMGADIDSACGQLIVAPTSTTTNDTSIQQPPQQRLLQERNEEVDHSTSSSNNNVPDIEDVLNRRTIRIIKNDDSIITQSQQQQQNIANKKKINNEMNNNDETVSHHDTSSSSSLRDQTTTTTTLSTNNEKNDNNYLITRRRQKRKQQDNDNNTFHVWIQPLTIATMVSTSLFVIASFYFVMQSTNNRRNNNIRMNA